jgi:hypothetical protein
MPGTASGPLPNRPPEDQWEWTIKIRRNKNRWHTLDSPELQIQQNHKWSVVYQPTEKDAADEKLISDGMQAIVNKLNGGVIMVPVKS